MANPVKLHEMRPSDAPAIASLLAPSMAWSESMVASTFALGHAVVAEVMTDGHDVLAAVHLVRGMPGVPTDLLLLRLAVAEGSRGHGLGARLWKRVLDQAPEGATVVARSAAEDGHSLAVASHWGLRQVNTTLFQRRDLVGAPVATAAPVPEAQVEVVRGRLVGTFCDRVRAIMAAGAIMDVPLASYVHPAGSTDEDETEPTMSLIAAQPGEAVAVFAVARGVDIGYTIGFDDGHGWHIADTGVVPSWRRRGVASWVKAELGQLAVRDGAQWITTHNDAANAPILALNEASGFQVIARSVSLRREPEHEGQRQT